MRSEVHMIDPKLGLHELANSFQLRSARHQAEELLSNLDNLVENTINKARCVPRTSAWIV